MLEFCAGEESQRNRVSFAKEDAAARSGSGSLTVDSSSASGKPMNPCPALQYTSQDFSKLELSIIDQMRENVSIASCEAVRNEQMQAARHSTLSSRTLPRRLLVKILCKTSNRSKLQVRWIVAAHSIAPGSNHCRASRPVVFP